MRNIFLFFDLSETSGISLDDETLYGCFFLGSETPYVDEYIFGGKTSSFLL